MINIYCQRLDETWYAVVLEDEKIWATSWDSNQQRVLKSVLQSLPLNTPFQMVEEQSELSEKLLTAMKAMLAGENISLSKFKFEMAHLPKYSQKVLAVLAKVPVGYVTTYGALAKTAGGGPRAVGRVMAANPFAPLIPCHRVVRSDFSVGGYGGEVIGNGPQTKRTILQRENRGYKEPIKIKISGSALYLFPVAFVRKD